MGVGPNYVLDKGFLATGTAGYSLGELVVQSGDGTEVAKAGAGGNVVGVCYEDIDAAKVTTGKAVINVRLLGIARVVAGGAVAVGDGLVADANAHAVPAAPAVGASVALFGRALTAAAAEGDMIDVLLTPGGRSAVGA